MSGRLEGKLALVTGASRGIGYAVAERFAAEGAHVIATARTTGGLEQLDDAIKKAGGTATLAPLNLQEFDKIDMMAASIHQRFGKLDILVGNAGLLGELAPTGHISPKIWTRAMDVNVTANWRLIRAFDPLLRLSENGRAIFTTCEAAQDHKAFWALPAASKAALEALVHCYQKELSPTNVKASLVDPGPVDTKHRTQAYPGETEGTHPKPNDPSVTDKFVEAAV